MRPVYNLKIPQSGSCLYAQEQSPHAVFIRMASYSSIPGSLTSVPSNFIEVDRCAESLFPSALSGVALLFRSGSKEYA